LEYLSVELCYKVSGKTYIARLAGDEKAVPIALLALDR
jgi:hypothetical protein